MENQFDYFNKKANSQKFYGAGHGENSLILTNIQFSTIIKSIFF